jgi:hypothetical protein
LTFLVSVCLSHFSSLGSLGVFPRAIQFISYQVPDDVLRQAGVDPSTVDKEPVDDLKDDERVKVRVLALQLYLLHLLGKVDDIPSPAHLAQNMYTTRFRRLYPDDSYYMQAPENDLGCDAASGLWQDKGALGTRHRHVTSLLVRWINKKDMRRVTGEIAEQLNALSPEARLHGLRDYVESLARWALGGPDRVALFVRQCLNFKEHLQEPGDAEEEGNTLRFEESGPLSDEEKKAAGWVEDEVVF